MIEQLITKEQAKIVLEIGLDNRSILDRTFSTGSNICTQSLLQKNLRDLWNIHITIFWNGTFDFYVKEQPEKILNERLRLYNTYEEALDAALTFALEYIQTNKGI